MGPLLNPPGQRTRGTYRPRLRDAETWYLRGLNRTDHETFGNRQGANGPHQSRSISPPKVLASPSISLCFSASLSLASGCRNV